MTDYQNWQLSVDDLIATLTLNRADKMNTLTPETLHELREICGVIAGRSDIWALILEGAGDNFSAGVDVSVIGEMADQIETLYRQNLADLQDCLDVFEKLEIPTIAKIHGYCVGGALILALCCDFRVAAENTTFIVPEVKLGIAVLMGTERILRVAGVGPTKEMVLLGDPFDAQTAQRWNLLHRVVPEKALHDEAMKIATTFRERPPRTVAIAKRIIDHGHLALLHEGQNLEIDLQADLLQGADFKEGVASFFEKRPPRFTGE